MSIENIAMFLKGNNELAVLDILLTTFSKYAWKFEEYDDLAKVYFKVKDYNNAIKFGEYVLGCAYNNQQIYIARSNLINVYNHANFPEKALTLIKANEIVIPNDSDTRLEKAYSNFLMNDRDSAEKILREELQREDIPEEIKTKILFNLGTYELYRDNFQKGLRLFLLQGEKLNYWRKSKLPMQFWNGKIQKDKEIILYTEAGIGDEIINIRFMKHLENLGMIPIWCSDRKDLAEVFIRNGFRVITTKEALTFSRDTFWTYPMSLPVYLELEYKDLWNGPYLKASEEYSKKWSHIKKDKPSIGIRWQGNTEYDQDLHRSLPLDQLYNTIKEFDTNIYSLQKDSGLENIKDFDLVDLSEKLSTWEDTLGIINNLDIIITSCTSVAHAAAAMGKETIILIPISSYYTWSHSLEKSPWYGDNLTLIRQTKPRSWEAPFQKLKEILSKRLL